MRKIRPLAAVAVLFLPVQATFGASISGDGKTVESTPTPKRSTIRPSPTPDETDASDEPALSSPVPKTAIISTEKRRVSVAEKEKFAALMRSAVTKFRARDYTGALQLTDEADALIPGQLEVLNLRGGTYSEMGEYEKGAAFYRKALLIQPESFWPNYNLAEISFMQKDFPKARASFEAMMPKFPSNELLQFKIFLTYLEEQKNPEAKATLDKMPFPSKTAAYYFAWAAWEFRHGRQEAGEEWIRSGRRIFGHEKTRFLAQSLADLKMMPPQLPPAEELAKDN